MDASEPSSPLAQCADAAQNEPVVLIRGGMPFAVVLPVPNADRETIGLASNPRFLAIIERSRESHRQRGGVDLDEVRRMLGA